ncbi:MAG: hypothetical protein Q8M76_15985, partial [Spirochaetaceae bacterium]|nr:hypothetical protein [Spirochaetaceae bacterium]
MACYRDIYESNSLKRKLGTALLAVASLGLTTCNLFKAGLGAKIDVDPPSITVASHQSGSYVRGDFTLSGTAIDDIEVTSVSIEVKAYATGESLGVFDASISADRWSRTFSSNSFINSSVREIQLSLVITVKDGSGKSSKTTPPLVLVVDEVPPNIILSSPSENQLLSDDPTQILKLNNVVHFTGSASDSMGAIKQVFTRSTTPGTTEIVATGTNFWSLNLDTKPITDAASSTLATMNLEIVAEDYAGNTTAIALDGMHIDQNADAPTFAAKFGEARLLNLEMKAGALPSSTEVYAFVSGYSFTVIVEDDDAIDEGTVDVAITPVSGGATLSARGQGWLVMNSGQDPTLPQSLSYKMSFPLTMSEGEYALSFVAKDDLAGKAGADAAVAERAIGEIEAAIIIDNGAPVLLVTGIDHLRADNLEGNFSNAFVYDLEISGTATDGYDIASVTVEIDGASPSKQLYTLTSGSGLTGSAGNYTFSCVPGIAMTEGTHSVLVTAHDKGAKTDVWPLFNFNVDATNPSVTINAVSGYVSDIISIGGTATDANLTYVEYQLGSTAGAWTRATGAGAWTGNLDMTGASEGAVTLYARSIDKAGNASSNASTTINIDHENPRATEVNYGDDTIVAKSAVTFSGIADDSTATPGRAASVVDLAYSKNGAAATHVALTPVAGAWTWTLPVNATTHADDGLYQITLTVTDQASKQASKLRTVQVDTTGPTLVVDAPVNNESTTNSLYDISGSSRDTGGVGFDGVDDVEYNLDATGWTSLTLIGTAWSRTGVNLGATEGSHSLQFRSTDKSGNETLVGSLTLYY